MENKVTKKMRFEEMKGIMVELGKTELVEFIDHEIELIDRKAMNRKAGNDKKTQENCAIAEIVLDELVRIGKTTITDLLKKSEVLADYVTEDGKTLSNQKITAILKPFVADGTVVRTMEKKSTFFQIAQQ
jgi:hypothetical protein